MTYPQTQAPAPQPAANPKNGLGTAGFVLGLVGLIFSFIPLIGVVAWPLVILGIIFGAIGTSRAFQGKATNKGLAIAGVVLSIVGLVICIVWTAAAKKAVDDVSDEANRQVTVHYEVTGDAKQATITYTTVGDGSATMNQEQVTTLPWSKDQQTKGLIKGGSLTVTAGVDGGSVGCNVTVDGKATKTATASGPLATASCDGF